MTPALSAVLIAPRRDVDVRPPRVAADGDRLRHTVPGPPTQRITVGASPDIVDEWGMQSFPASDPPANW